MFAAPGSIGDGDGVAAAVSTILVKVVTLVVTFVAVAAKVTVVTTVAVTVSKETWVSARHGAAVATGLLLLVTGTAGALAELPAEMDGPPGNPHMP